MMRGRRGVVKCERKHDGTERITWRTPCAEMRVEVVSVSLPARTRSEGLCRPFFHVSAGSRQWQYSRHRMRSVRRRTYAAQLTTFRSIIGQLKQVEINAFPTAVLTACRGKARLRAIPRRPEANSLGPTVLTPLLKSREVRWVNGRPAELSRALWAVCVTGSEGRGRLVQRLARKGLGTHRVDRLTHRRRSIPSIGLGKWCKSRAA